jgi:hypothetical protein
MFLIGEVVKHYDELGVIMHTLRKVWKLIVMHRLIDVTQT